MAGAKLLLAPSLKVLLEEALCNSKSRCLPDKEPLPPQCLHQHADKQRLA